MREYLGGGFLGFAVIGVAFVELRKYVAATICFVGAAVFGVLALMV